MVFPSDCCKLRLSSRPADGRRGGVVFIFETKIAKVCDKAARPPIDVVLLHVSPHSSHSTNHLRDVHVEGLGNCIRSFLNVIGIYENCVVQLPRRSCELAQDQDASFIVPGRNILFGNQIHPVVQGRNHAQMCGTIVALNLLMTVLTVLKDNWSPLAAFETGVDPIGFSLNLSLEVSISFDAATS